MRVISGSNPGKPPNCSPLSPRRCARKQEGGGVGLKYQYKIFPCFHYCIIKSLNACVSCFPLFAQASLTKLGSAYSTSSAGSLPMGALYLKPSGNRLWTWRSRASGRVTYPDSSKYRMDASARFLSGG